MAVADKPRLTDLVRWLGAESERLYRLAVGDMVLGGEADREWDEWQNITSVLLLVAWVRGANSTIKKARIPREVISESFTFDRNEPLAMAFEPGPQREVVERYMATIPLTRDEWKKIIGLATSAANEMRRGESIKAIEALIIRSPHLARILRPENTGALPQEPEGLRRRIIEISTTTRRTPQVQEIVSGSFFVSGMNIHQIKAVRTLLSKVIKGKVSKSVAGKELRHLGVGDWVEQAVLKTGTNLTKARLETVYRTNLNRAASQGQLDVVRNKTVQAFVPLMQYSATRDNRTRETHKAMNGFVASVQQIDSQGIATPAGFNCRCGWSPISAASAKSHGFIDTEGNSVWRVIQKHNGKRQSMIDSGEFPDSGFLPG